MALASNKTFHFYPLEPRILLSGEGLDGTDGLDAPAAEVEEVAEALIADAEVEAAAAGEAPNGDPLQQNAPADSTDTQPALLVGDPGAIDPSEPLEVVFIDASVEDAEELIAGLRQDAGDPTQWLVYELAAESDGVEQITGVLSELNDVLAVHLVSHGDDQGLQLGAARLDLDAAAGHAGEIASWADALAPDADLLLYGCDLASSAEGRALVDAIGELAGADVAASDDATGSAAQGGDWQLEYTTGTIETSVAFDQPARAQWDSVLATFTVTNDNDSGFGSLRQAIADANITVGTDTIVFDIGAGGQQTISLASALPAITEAVVIDATTQGGFGGTPLIELDGSMAGSANGLVLSADNSTIRGLIVNRFARDGIIVGGDSNAIAGNWIGLDATGTIAAGNGIDGIRVTGQNNLIGGNTAADRNVISGNADEAIDIDPGATGNVIQGNHIGANVHLNNDIPNGSLGTDSSGIRVEGANTTIGGSGSGEGNLIGGNDNDGIIVRASDAVIQGNFIGYNAGSGIHLDGVSAANATIGGVGSGEGNMIMENDGDGVELSATAGSGNTIRGNSVYDNGGLAIDLGADGVTVNDAGDADTGANALHNFPLLTKAAVGDGTITISGTLDSTAGGTRTIDFYANSSADASGHGEARRYLGSTTVSMTTGTEPFRAYFAASVAAGERITATATDASGNTSELSLALTAEYSTNSLWLSTEGDVVGGGTPGLDSYDDGETVSFGDPGFTLGPGTTSGTLSSLGDLDIAVGDGDARVDALHYVTRAMTVGSGASAVTLQSGDVLLSFQDDETLNGGTLLTQKDDVLLFRPVGEDDYSHGSFSVLLDNVSSLAGGTAVTGISLVETDTTIGDTSVNQGSFLLTRDGVGASDDIWLLETTGVGTAATTGAVSQLIEGADLGFDSSLSGIELVEGQTTIGGVTMSAGTILGTLDASDASVADNGLSVDQTDVFSLNVTQTTLASGDSAASASILFDGSDVGFDTAAESPNAVTLHHVNHAPSISLPGGAIHYTENGGPVVIDPNAGATDVDPSYLDTGTLTVDFTAGSTAHDRLSIEHQGTGVGQVGVSGSDILYEGTVVASFTGGTDGTTPMVVTFNTSSTPAAAQAVMRNITYENVSDDPSTASRTVRFVLTDGDGGTSNTETETIHLTAVNDEQSVDTNAELTLGEGTTATLSAGELATVDPDNTPAEVVYTVSSAPLVGTLKLSGVALAATDTFTQADIDNNRVTYTHDDSETWTDRFDFSVDDGTGAASTGTFHISITPVNDHGVTAVSDTDGSGEAVLENSSIGTTVGLTAFADDADANDSITYSLDDDHAGRFAIDADTGVVTVAGAIDREAGGASRDITVRATSSDGSFQTRTFSISIGDVDESDIGPVTDADGSANAVDENAAAGTAVGVTATASDADATNNAVTYSLDDDAGGRFAIDANTGEVTVADGSLLDRESAASHDITVRASSSDGSSSTQDFTIHVGDVDEFDVGPVSDTDPADAAVDENAANGTATGVTAFAEDDDAGDAVTYSLDDDAGGRFAVDANTGQVTVADGSLLDYESAASHGITVRATSSDGSSNTQSYTISVEDVNEFDVGAITDTDPGANAVDENAASGTATGVTASAEDADAGDTVTYSLDDDAGGRFEIDANTGEVTVADGSLVDRESAASHEITVRASSSDGSSSTQDFTIHVNDVDEFDAGPVSDTDTAADAVDENAADGTAVGVTALAEDADAGDAVTYSLDDDAGGRFAVDANTGQVTVADGSLLDYESAASHGITVRATSSDGSSSTQSYTISVEDVNEFDVDAITDTDPGANAVDENAASGTATGVTASADDADAGDTVTYSLDDDAGGRFAVDANTGEVTVADGSLLDRESAASHEITVRATSSDGSSSTESFTISLNDQNDNSPVVTPGQTFTIDENSASGTPIGSAAATDPDITSTLQDWQIVSGNADGHFAIDAATGELTVAAPGLDFEGQPQYTIAVQVSDGNVDSAVETIVIDIGDVNEAPVGVGGESYSTNAGQSIRLQSPLPEANDSDVDGDSLSVVIVTQPAGGTLNVGEDGTLVYTPDAGFFGTETIQYRVTDGSLESDVVQLTVEVTAVGGGSGSGSGSGDSDGGNEEPSESESGDEQNESKEPGDGEPAQNSAVAPVGPLIDRGDSSDGSSPDAASSRVGTASEGGAESDAQRGGANDPAAGDVVLGGLSAGTSTSYDSTGISAAELEVLEHLLLEDLTQGISWEQWEQIRQDPAHSMSFSEFTIGAAGTTVGIASVGYVLWALRGGMFLGMLSTGIPSWRMIDPTALLTAYRAGRDTGTDRLDDLIR